MRVLGMVRRKAILVLCVAALAGGLGLLLALAVPAAADDGVVAALSASFEVVGSGGDCNADGRANVLDVTCVERIILTLRPDTPGADANKDGVVNALDITAFERMILGIWGR